MLYYNIYLNVLVYGKGVSVLEASDVSQQIGTILRRLRKERGWTLDQMAQATSVSKPMLGQIERGETNPTVVTLWKITGGLNVPFSTFLQGLEPPRVQLIPQVSQVVVEDDAGNYRVQSIVGVRYPHSSDLFKIVLRGGATHRSEPHGDFVQESIWVQQGQLQLTIGSENYILEPGDAVQFAADTGHEYRNSGSTDCSFLVLLVYGNDGLANQVP